jgi:hypothetical protein
MENPAGDWHSLPMRVNLITQSPASSFPGKGAFPVSLTIRPACGLPGDYEYKTTSSSLLELLKKNTDLPASVIQRFEGNLYGSDSARLLGVELSERVLTDIGYFVD